MNYYNRCLINLFTFTAPPTTNGHAPTDTLQAPFVRHVIPPTDGLSALTPFPAPIASGSTQPNFFTSSGPSFQAPLLNPRASPFTPIPAPPLEAPKETLTPVLPSPSYFPTSTGSPLDNPRPSASGVITRTLSAPPSLKIDTSPSVSPFVSSHPGSPALPPLLAKPQTIPLPPTPTTTINTQPPSTLVGHLRSSFDSPVAFNTPEILSPLNLTPAASPSKVNNFSPAALSKLKRLKTENSLSSFLNGKGKAPESFRTGIPDSSEELKAQALAFAQKGLVVKTCFKRWLQRTMDNAAWLEACQHSEAYREKVQHQKQARDSPIDKKRRISNGPIASSVSPKKKRVRRRVSAEYKPPRTDEELARRFKEVQIVPFHPSLSSSIVLTAACSLRPSLSISESQGTRTSLGTRIFLASNQKSCQADDQESFVVTLAHLAFDEPRK